MEKRNYSLYIHTNKINHKKYVGITSREPKERWDYGCAYKSCTYFDRAIKKYGWNNFTHEVVLTNLTKEEAEEQERYNIALYRTNQQEYGYNLTEGGFCGTNFTKKNFKGEKLPPYELIKKNKVAMALFNSILKNAYGFEYKEYEITILYNDKGEKISEKTKEIIKKETPHLFAVDMILENYSNVKELKTDIENLKIIREQLIKELEEEL